MKKLFAAFRIKEIVGKSGFFLVGCLFAQPELSTTNIIVGGIFFLLCMVNGAAIYLFNAALGYQQDLSNDRLGNLQTFSRSETLIIGSILAVLALTGMYFFSPRLIIPSILVYVIWILYSIPKGLKGIPFMGLTCAFVGEMLHFHIGYLVFGEVGIFSLALSVYFGLLFAAGHALHEVIDFDADKEANVRTTAVQFGRKNGLYISNGIFILSATYLLAMSFFEILPISLMLYLAAFVLQCVGYLFKRRDLSKENLFAYRRDYMLAYAIATMFVVGALYFEI